MHALLEKLRALPEPVLGEGAEEIDYAELEVGEEGADLLCELLLADGIPAGLDEEGWLRIRVHAWRALGVRGEMQFFALFLALLRNAVLDGDDYYCEEFVSLMVCLGDEAVPPLLALLFDSREGEELRANVAMALDALAEREEVRETITGEYARFLAQKGPSRLLNGFIVGSLIDLDAVEHVEVIRELFEENLVNVAINGDMEQVEIRLGIRESRSSERPDFMELEKTLAHQARRDELGAPPETEDPLKVLSYFLALHGTVRSFRSVSMLDGFLLACVCAPDPVMPSRYMPLIWDMKGNPELEPVWDSTDEAQLFHEALMNLQNAGVEAMQTATFAPVALLEDVGNGPKERFHDWALGVLTGMSLWDFRNQQMEELKERLTTELLEVIRRESENEDAKEGVGIPPLRRAVALLQGAYGQHKEDFLSAQSAGRALSFTGGDPYQREVPKIGRNDPCPCGSGKKYKKCCMG